ncbi:tRNA lysidine(34) synthetase TilS [Pseudidiomarina taiwanensis]|uniref:tRNA lysidine(34) synthetase TilS n=1 Tax=Pseudidiomarina taiwanensis TaxID=337250 RepID=UPI000F88EAAE|nr:tRNA lysidine(34) synthetase TilS [Pseudidiomarina taiwanensis]
MATALSTETSESVDLYDVFEQSLAQFAATPKQLFIACLGGGADSQTILDLLDRYRQANPCARFLAIHLDHQFHPDSGAWAASLEADCARRQFPYYGEVIEVAVNARASKEAQGREHRYQRLRELALEYNMRWGCSEPPVLLLGQHRNDQIETFLLQLKRGAGPRGLAAMASRREDIQATTPIHFVRPLLQVSKAQIYAYAKQFQLHWVEDETNYDRSIDRNYFRHEVIPLIEQRWPHFGDAVLRSARLCAEQQQLLDELLARDVAEHIDASGALAIGWLEQASATMQRAVLRYWLQQLGTAMPSYAQLEQLREQMLASENDRKPVVSWGNFQVERINQPRKNRRLVVTQLEATKA